MILDGKKIAQNTYESLKSEVSKMHLKPSLKVILVGNNPSSLRYVGQKEKWANYVGIDFDLIHLDQKTSEDHLLAKIETLNNDESTTAFMVQLPLPNHIDSQKVINLIKPEKDADGFTDINMGKIVLGDTNCLEPCTPKGIMELLKASDIELSGKHAVVIGRSNIVGKPIANMLINAGSTVTVCNSRTENLKYYTKNADIIIVATGQPEMLTLDHINDQSVIIDVGFTVIDGKIYGDSKFDEIHANGNLITPVPGGVGPMTVAMLMKNVVQAAK